jgi:hypothetical protein
VAKIAVDHAEVRDPPRSARLQLSRPVYELFLRFARPTWVDDVVPPDPPRRERAVECIRHLERKGFLAPPGTLIPRLGGGAADAPS